MVGELKVIEGKVYTKQKDENPVNKFQDNADDGYTSVVLANIYTTKFVLNPNSHGGGGFHPP